VSKPERCQGLCVPWNAPVLAASPQSASCRLVQAERHALVVPARTRVFPGWPFGPARVNLAAQLTDAPDRSVKIRDAEEDHEPGLGSFVHSARDPCRLDRRAVAATFVELPAEQCAVKNLRPPRVWHPDLEMRRLSHTTHLLSSAEQHRVLDANYRHDLLAVTAQSTLMVMFVTAAAWSCWRRRSRRYNVGPSATQLGQRQEERQAA
jgi:hypothetical protein